jgi:diacylglycerol kinase (ATP)
VEQNIGKALFIVNKKAGIGDQSQVEREIIESCIKNNVEFNVEFTTGPGHAIELAQSAHEKGFRQVIAVGGDGTSNEVAQGLIHTAMPMGIIPGDLVTGWPGTSAYL